MTNSSFSGLIPSFLFFTLPETVEIPSTTTDAIQTQVSTPQLTQAVTPVILESISDLLVAIAFSKHNMATRSKIGHSISKAFIVEIATPQCDHETHTEALKHFH